jgi:L,D-transpeptidase YbiS
VVGDQVAVVEGDGEVLARFPVSTSKFGLGSEEGSYRTPLGRFVVAEKIGEGLAPWSILRGRVPTGELALPGGEEDLILTRILRLQGLEEGNANTWERYIYFHGTNQEDLLGRPASHGCIRLGNAEMVRLFELVPVGAEVEIVQADLPPCPAGGGDGL